MTPKEQNDYFYVCSLIEYIARKTKNNRGTIVNLLGKKGIEKQLYDAEVNHCLSFDQVSDELIEFYNIHIYFKISFLKLVQFSSLLKLNKSKIVADISAYVFLIPKLVFGFICFPYTSIGVYSLE